MAEFKTAEQYVVNRLETVEKELEDVKVEHSLEMAKMEKMYAEMCNKYHDASIVLGTLRDFLVFRKDSYFGNIVDLDTIYGKEHPDTVEMLMEYFDVHTEDDDDE